MLPAMIFASAIVIIAIAGVVLHQHWWVVGIAVAVEVALILAGVRWIAPVLSDGESPDTSASEDPTASVSSLDADHSPDRAPDHAPHLPV